MKILLNYPSVFMSINRPDCKFQPGLRIFMYFIDNYAS